jgi:hypothetical protein
VFVRADTWDCAFIPSRVLLALLRGTSEERFLAALAGAPVPVQEHHKRVTLLARLKVYRPTVLVLPVTDQRSRPSSPLIESCRATLPTIRIIAVSTDVSRTRHLLETLRQDVTVLVQPSEAQLRSVVLERTLRARLPLPSADELFSGVRPAVLRRVLETAWAASEHRVSLRGIALHLGTSTRTLEREAVRQKVASPREMLAAVRFLRAYAAAALLHPSPERDDQLDQTTSGARTYEPASPLPPLLSAVAHRVRALGGTLPPHPF